MASADDAECIVAKAIRDGGIDAVIDHEGGFMASKEVRVCGHARHADASLVPCGERPDIPTLILRCSRR